MDDQSFLRPTDGHIVAGVLIDDHRFLGRMKASQLFQVAIDPRRTEDLRQLEGNTQLESVRRIRMEVQRLFEGAKAKNAPVELLVKNGDRYSTVRVDYQESLRYPHLDHEAVRAYLRDIRSRDMQNGIMVVSEGIFSMDADAPKIEILQEICHEYGATLFVDVAHDLGATGPDGKGQLGVQKLLGKVDLVMGSFSKSFAGAWQRTVTRRSRVSRVTR